MTRRAKTLLVVLLLLVVILVVRLWLFFNTVRLVVLDPPRRVPEINDTTEVRWFNSLPLRLSNYQGTVLLLFVWTFD